ncbi:MAG: acyl-CoA dehydrogenase family protein, partial [Parvibaculum sp.]
MTGFLRGALTANETALIDRAAAFARNTVAPNAAGWERARRQPVEALREAAALGLAALEVPREAGGPGHRYMVKLALCEEMSRADMAFTFSLVNTQNVAARLALSPTARHRDVHVPALM